MQAADFRLCELPIEVPFHSIIGQQHPGSKEHGSDGVVPYWSSHLDGAASECVVRSGHGVIGNAEAINEVIRILSGIGSGKAVFGLGDRGPRGSAIEKAGSISVQRWR